MRATTRKALAETESAVRAAWRKYAAEQNVEKGGVSDVVAFDAYLRREQPAGVNFRLLGTNWHVVQGILRSAGYLKPNL